MWHETNDYEFFFYAPSLAAAEGLAGDLQAAGLMVPDPPSVDESPWTVTAHGRWDPDRDPAELMALWDGLVELHDGMGSHRSQAPNDHEFWFGARDEAAAEALAGDLQEAGLVVPDPPKLDATPWCVRAYGTWDRDREPRQRMALWFDLARRHGGRFDGGQSTYVWVDGGDGAAHE